MIMTDLIVYPSDYYNLGKVDADLKAEYEGALSTGKFEVILFGYDKWFNDDELVLSCVPRTKRKAVYRGWMMQPEKYKKFYEKLYVNNIELITSPKEYELLHIFPNVYQLIADDTAKMQLFPLHKTIDISALHKEFDKFLVKDYVKSVKGTEFPEYFDQSVTQTNFDKWMKVFYKYRGELLTGGICIKEYLPLKRIGDRTNEYRVFYCNGEVLSVCRNSLQPYYSDEMPEYIVDKYKNLQSIYYTIDFAELEDCTWKIIETGDGSVSGLSPEQNIEAYYRSLYNAINK